MGIPLIIDIDQEAEETPQNGAEEEQPSQAINWVAIGLLAVAVYYLLR